MWVNLFVYFPREIHKLVIMFATSFRHINADVENMKAVFLEYPPTFKKLFYCHFFSISYIALIFNEIAWLMQVNIHSCSITVCSREACKFFYVYMERSRKSMKKQMIEMWSNWNWKQSWKLSYVVRFFNYRLSIKVSSIHPSWGTY